MVCHLMRVESRRIIRMEFVRRGCGEREVRCSTRSIARADFRAQYRSPAAERDVIVHTFSVSRRETHACLGAVPWSRV